MRKNTFLKIFLPLFISFLIFSFWILLITFIWRKGRNFVCFAQGRLDNFFIDTIQVSEGNEKENYFESDYLEIKNISLGELVSDENIFATITLFNKSGEDLDISRVLLIASKLDGSDKVISSKEKKERVKSGETLKIDLEFPVILKNGYYVGTFEVYSEDKLLASSKTLIENLPSRSKVLGTSSYNFKFSLLPFTVLFLLVFLTAIFIRVKRPLVLKIKLGFEMRILVLLMIGISAWGIGFCFSYTFFENYSSLVPVSNWIEKFKGYDDFQRFHSQSNLYDLIFIYNGEGLNLYSKPNDQAEVIGEIRKNSGLKVIDKASGWYRVILDDETNGWIRIEDVRKMVK